MKLDDDPVVLDDAVMKEIATKLKVTSAQVSGVQSLPGGGATTTAQSHRKLFLRLYRLFDCTQDDFFLHKNDT